MELEHFLQSSAGLSATEGTTANLSVLAHHTSRRLGTGHDFSQAVELCPSWGSAGLAGSQDTLPCWGPRVWMCSQHQGWFCTPRRPWSLCGPLNLIALRREKPDLLTLAELGRAVESGGWEGTLSQLGIKMLQGLTPKQNLYNHRRLRITIWMSDWMAHLLNKSRGRMKHV